MRETKRNSSKQAIQSNLNLKANPAPAQPTASLRLPPHLYLHPVLSAHGGNLLLSIRLQGKTVKSSRNRSFTVYANGVVLTDNLNLGWL